MKFFLLVILPLYAFNVFAQNRQSREVVNMNTSWTFTLTDNQQYAQPDYDDNGWRVINVPHDWSIEGRYDKNDPSGPMGGYLPCGTAWYRKRFTVPERTQNKRFFIHFDGVYMKSQVWINGRMVGEYPNGYNSFEYDITSFVKHDGENVLAVRVDNSLQPASRWYAGSGIYRDVKLIITDQLHFITENVFITTPLVKPTESLIHVSYKIICNNYAETRFNWVDNTSLYIWTRDENNTSEAQQTQSNNRVQKVCTITSVLYDFEGKEVLRKSSLHNIGDFSELSLIHEIPIRTPQLWSPDTPYLYKLVSTISYDGVTRDSITNPVGIREFTYSSENGMAINGKPIKVQGVSLHQSVGCFGSAVPSGVWRERLIRLKEMGCNAIRTHYPLMSEFQNICDTLGILVSKEIFDEWNRGQEWGYSETSYGKLAYTYHLYFDQWYDTDLRRMIRRDRNHPSVFLYMLGNEIPNQRINGIEIARKLYTITKEEDPTRPVTSACDFFVGANIYGFMDVFDIAGYNYIDRIHEDSLYEAEHVRYPNRILLGTETYHKTRNHVSIRDTESCIGEFVWVGYDYLGEILWPGYRGWDHGIIDIAGFPKPEYYLRKSYWSEEPVVHIAVERSKGKQAAWFQWEVPDVADHWNWQDKGDQLLPVFVYANCDEAELFLNSKSLGRKRIGKNDYHAQWEVPFKAGTIKAVGFKRGKKVCEHQLTTASNPYALKVSRTYQYDNTIRVEIEVVDKKGIKVPFGEHLVSIQNTVNAMPIGIDNGNQFDPAGIKYTSKKEGYTADGRMVIYLQMKNAGRSVSLSIQSEGLKPLTISM